MSVVFTESCTAPEIDKKEIFRYAGCAKPDSALVSLVDECLFECEDKLSYKVCFAEFPIKPCGGTVEFPFMTAKSLGLSKNLDGCKSTVVFAATVGIGLDRLIAKYSRISPSRALIFQAIGAERIESLCNAFNRKTREKYESLGMSLRPRFSPGYGDFALEHQADIFRALDCPRKIGLTLGGSLLMSPSKSVTAIIGVSDGKKGCGIENSCLSCGKTDCDFRR